MFRQSPYYYEVRQEVFKEINNDLAKELSLMKLSDQRNNQSIPITKKSVSKQEFISYFYKQQKQNEQIMETEEETNLVCKNCDTKPLNANTICVECSRLACQKCIYQCYYCGQLCCLICSVKIYLHNGDFVSCLHCSQNQ
ncbi:unnamed protein product [Paramecium sonneborni]|uniref:Apoptosis regulatory protein Siva n=1 Tax=Paramecium sonneborni TaxID=65129 RepID=A0A8S1KRW2_9CILI|nr:unnamed protein product [Paramecium sonneborni]